MGHKLIFPDAPPPINAKSIRLHVNLTHIENANDKDANIISYRELLRKHLAAHNPTDNDSTDIHNHNINEISLFSSPSLARGDGSLPDPNNTTTDSHNAKPTSNEDPLLDSGPDASDRDETDDDGPSGEGSSQALETQQHETAALSRKKKRPIFDGYDLDDAFIDDSDLFGAEVNYAPPAKWEYGFFVWKGPVENFFDEYGVNDDQSLDESPHFKRKIKSKTNRMPKGQKDSPLKANINCAVMLSETHGNATSSTYAGESSAKKRKDSDGTEKAKKKSKQAIITPSSTSTTDAKNSGLDATTSIGALLHTLMRESANSKAPHDSSTPNASLTNGNLLQLSTTSTSALLQTPQPSATPNYDSQPPTAQLPTVVDTPSPPDTTEESLDPIPHIIHPSYGTSRSVSNEEPSGRKKRMSPQPISFELETTLKKFREAAAKESFADKKHFPPTLRPILHEAARVSLRLGENHDNFIAHIMSILPYNSFTLKKLVGKMILPEKIKLKENQLDQLYGKFRSLIDAYMSAHSAEYEVALQIDTETIGENLSVGDAVELSAKKFKMPPTIREAMSLIVDAEILLSEAKNDLSRYLGEKTLDRAALEKLTRRLAHAKLLEYWPTGTPSHWLNLK